MAPPPLHTSLRPSRRSRFETELFGPLLVTEEVLAEPLRYADFALKVPDGPGLGVELDMDRVALFRRDAVRTSFPDAASARSTKG